MKSIGPEWVFLDVLIDQRLQFVRLGGGVIEPVDQVVMHILIVSNRASRLQALGGIDLLADIAVVLGHQEMQRALRLRIARHTFLENLRSDRAALGPVPDPAIVGEALNPDLAGKLPSGELVQHLLTEFCSGDNGVGAAHGIEILNRCDPVPATNLGGTLPQPDDSAGLGGLQPIFQLLERVRQADFQCRALRCGGVAGEKLPHRRRQVFVARQPLLRVDQLQHHRAVTRVRRMRGHELLGDAHQTKQPPVAVVQVGQLDHHLGGFGRGVLELAEVRLQCCRLLPDSIHHGRFLTIRRTQRTGPQTPHQNEMDSLHDSHFTQNRQTTVRHTPAPRSPQPQRPEPPGTRRHHLSALASASEIFLASAASGLSGNSLINCSNRFWASARRSMRNRQRP